MRVIVARQVKDFLAAEKAYLRKHSDSASQRLTYRMSEAARMLSNFPMLGSERALPVKGIRRLVLDDYVLDYEIREREVHILNMRHGRQQDPYLEYEDDFDLE